jgi:hypothetical protein
LECQQHPATSKNREAFYDPDRALSPVHASDGSRAAHTGQIHFAQSVSPLKDLPAKDKLEIDPLFIAPIHLISLTNPKSAYRVLHQPSVTDNRIVKSYTILGYEKGMSNWWGIPVAPQEKNIDTTSYGCKLSTLDTCPTRELDSDPTRKDPGIKE